MKNSHLFISLFLIFSISCAKSVKQEPESTSDDSLIREYHSNGKLKTEISAAGNLRQGPTRNYNFQGQLISEVNYNNNLKDGLATNYYPVSGKKNSTLVYKNGIKEGDETWFYESGQVYRLSPYVAGKINGIQKFYYQTGELMAEVPYKDGFAGTGLKEYKKDGTVLGGYPNIVIRKEDHLKDANKIVLVISLSNESKNVKFYEGSLSESRYLSNKLLLLATQNGITQIDYNIAPGVTLKQRVVISANYKTPMGNSCILTKTYNLEAFNP